MLCNSSDLPWERGFSLKFCLPQESQSAHSREEKCSEKWEDIGSKKRGSHYILVNLDRKMLLFLGFFWQLKRYCTKLNGLKNSTMLEKTMWNLLTVLSDFNSGCSLCSDPLFYNWEALRHPGQLEIFDKRKLTALTNPLLNLPFFSPACH